MGHMIILKVRLIFSLMSILPSRPWIEKKNSFSSRCNMASYSSQSPMLEMTSNLVSIAANETWRGGISLFVDILGSREMASHAKLGELGVWINVSFPLSSIHLIMDSWKWRQHHTQDQVLYILVLPKNSWYLSNLAVIMSLWAWGATLWHCASECFVWQVRWERGGCELDSPSELSHS